MRVPWTGCTRNTFTSPTPAKTRAGDAAQDRSLAVTHTRNPCLSLRNVCIQLNLLRECSLTIIQAKLEATKRFACYSSGARLRWCGHRGRQRVPQSFESLFKLWTFMNRGALNFLLHLLPHARLWRVYLNSCPILADVAAQ